jgi:hypothetical protein
LDCVLGGFNTIEYLHDNNEEEQIPFVEQSMYNGVLLVKEQFEHQIRMGRILVTDSDFVKLLSLM